MQPFTGSQSNALTHLHVLIQLSPYVLNGQSIHINW